MGGKVGCWRTHVAGAILWVGRWGGEGYNFGLGRILIEDLTKEEMRRFRLIKAEGNYRTWKEMFLDKSGVKR